MKQTATAWHKSIFTRLLMIFLIILVPLYAGGIAVYGWGVAAVQAETSRAIADQGNAWMRDFELEVERIRLLQYECLTDLDLEDLSVRAGAMDGLARTQAVNRLLNRLSALRSSSRYIAQASIMIPAIDRTLISRGSVTEMDRAQFDRLRAEAGHKTPLVWAGGAPRLSAAYPIQNPSGSRSARAVIVVELSAAEIRRSMAAIGESGGRGTALAGPGGVFVTTGLAGEDAEAMAARAVQAAAVGLTEVKTDQGAYLASRSQSAVLDLSLYRFVPEKGLFTGLYRYRLWFWLFTVAAVAIITLFTVASRRLIDRPLNKLVQSFRSVENGDLDVRIEHRSDDEFRYLYRRFDEMAENLKALIDQAYRQKILAQRAELKHLQSQINPHFLYNSFFLLQNMVDRCDLEGASAFTRQLGAYFQFVTRSGPDEVPLRKEAAHAHAYVQIQARRFRGRIDVRFGDVPAELADLPVPRLILQPVIENAFEHGLEDKVDGGLLEVSFRAEGSFAVFRVEDNGGAVTAEGVRTLSAMLEGGQETTECTALANIHNRLTLRYGPGAGVRLSAGAEGGLAVELRIPLDRGRCWDVPAADR